MPCTMTTNHEPMSDKLKYRDDYIGMRSGNLVVIGYPANEDGERLAGVVCRCDCGNVHVVKCTGAFLNGSTLRCGECSHEHKVEAGRRAFLECWAKRGMDASPWYEHRNERLFRIWRGMFSRCGRDRYYKDVSVCDEWHDYLAFREWAHLNGYDEDALRSECTIDRINPFGDYEPSNCRWVDMFVQAHNKRSDWLRDRPDR